MSENVFTRDELMAIRERGAEIDPLTGQRRDENPHWKRGVFAAEVAMAERDQAAAAARAAPTPNREALQALAAAQSWVNPLTGRRQFEDMGPAGGAYRAAVEALRTDAVQGKPIARETLQDFEAAKQEAQAEAAALQAEREASELARLRQRERGY